jgi:acyl-coenzyme A synthetase/AMP-(fatty) acid ligase
LAVADEMREEEVLACVVAREGSVPGPDLARELFDYCNERLAYYKPPGWFVFVDMLPKTSTQKVQKNEVFPKGVDPRALPSAVDLRALKRRDRAS